MSTADERALLLMRPLVNDGFDHSDRKYMFNGGCFRVHSSKGATIIGIIWVILCVFALICSIVGIQDKPQAEKPSKQFDNKPLWHGAAIFSIVKIIFAAFLFRGLKTKSSNFLVPFTACQILEFACCFFVLLQYFISTVYICIIDKFSFNVISIYTTLAGILVPSCLISLVQIVILYRCCNYFDDLGRLSKNSDEFNHCDEKYMAKGCCFCSIHSTTETKIIGTKWTIVLLLILAATFVLICQSYMDAISIITFSIILVVVATSLISLFLGLKRQNSKLIFPFILCQILAFIFFLLAALFLFWTHVNESNIKGLHGQIALMLFVDSTISAFVIYLNIIAAAMRLLILAVFCGSITCTIGYQLRTLARCWFYLNDLTIHRQMHGCFVNPIYE